MKDLSLFGTEAWPVHPSGLLSLVTCPWRAAMEYMEEPDGVGGPAGDTGSAVHAAAAAFHRGSSVAESLGAMGDRAADYPRADLTDAAALFLAYASDPRNSAEVVLVEQPIAFSIAAAPEDPTGAPIQVIGTLDQVRRADGRLRLYDIKTTKKDPLEALHESAFQAAAYCVGASILLGKRVDPGALIFPRRYRADGSGPVFQHFPWTFDDCAQILEGVRHAVANIRAGRLYHVPNPGCFWCSARSPDFCLPKLQEHLRTVGE